MLLLTYRVWSDMSALGMDNTNELDGYITRLPLDKAIIKLDKYRCLVRDIDLTIDEINMAGLNDLDNLSDNEEDFLKNR